MYLESVCDRYSFTVPITSSFLISGFPANIFFILETDSLIYPPLFGFFALNIAQYSVLTQAQGSFVSSVSTNKSSFSNFLIYFLSSVVCFEKGEKVLKPFFSKSAKRVIELSSS